VIPPEVEMAEIKEKHKESASPVDSQKDGGGASSEMSVDDLLSSADKAAGSTNGPIVMILVGMAGSGKTTLTQRLTAELIRRGSPPYIVNLDPACRDPPYPVNIGRVYIAVHSLMSLD